MMNLKASAVNPYTWWALGLAFAISAAAATEIAPLLAIIAGVLAIAFAARESSRGSKSLSFYMATALIVVVIRLLFRIIFNFDTNQNVAVSLPALNIALGDLGSVELFGRVSWESLLGALRDGLRMASIILSVGLANTLANPRRLLKNTPGALYEIASAWVIAINMAPQLIDSANRVMRARRLRRQISKHTFMSSLIIPVLEDTIERSLALAASMSARGFGRQGHLSLRQHRASRLLSVMSVLCLALGAYLLLTLPNPWIATILLVVGFLAALVVGRIASMRQIRTRYQPEAWTSRDALICAAAAALALASVIGFF